MSVPEKIFAYRDYRAYLRARMASEPEPWGLIAKMAKAAQCQRSYLSKALKGEAQLTPAQGYGLARFWKLGAAETEYFLSLLEEERAGTLEYRQYIAGKSAALKKSQEDLSRRVNREAEVVESAQMEYYSAWYWTAIHILASVPEYQTAEAIARRLSLNPDRVLTVLGALDRHGLVRHEGGQWKFLAQESHVPKTSPLAAFHHANWRQRAVLDAQDPAAEGIHFTVVQSLSRADYERIRQMVLDFIERAARVAGPSREEELMCLACDFFKP